MALSYGSLIKAVQCIHFKHAIKVVHILIILVAQVHLGLQTAELDFNDDSGLFLVMYNSKWHSVCYHGDPNTWGKREAIVTCRQLGFTGGWPIQVQESDKSHPHLYNFDCDGTELAIKSCSFELATTCRNSKLAGIKCYGKFNMRIVDGPVESAGNIEVQYDNTWSAVCYVSIASETRTWTFQNAQIVCRELGFQGTMITRQGGVANGTQISSVDGYKCREDLRDVSLSDCLPDIPQKRTTKPSCGMNNEAVVICAGPGYVGCYSTNSLQMFLQIPAMQNMTTPYCRNYCRENNYTHAYLFSGNSCSCGNGVGIASVSDIRCRKTCTGNNNQVCGDVATSSVYDVQLGTCDHPSDPTQVYYYGTIINLPCGPEMKLGGMRQLQCVRNSSTNQDDLMWSQILSTCIHKESSTRTYPFTGASATGSSIRLYPFTGASAKDPGIITVSTPKPNEGERVKGVISGIVFFVAIIPAFIIPFVVYIRKCKKTYDIRKYMNADRSYNPSTINRPTNLGAKSETVPSDYDQSTPKLEVLEHESKGHQHTSNADSNVVIPEEKEPKDITMMSIRVDNDDNSDHERDIDDKTEHNQDLDNDSISSEEGSSSYKSAATSIHTEQHRLLAQCTDDITQDEEAEEAIDLDEEPLEDRNEPEFILDWLRGDDS